MKLSFYIKETSGKYYVTLSMYCTDGRVKKSMGAISSADLFPDNLPKKLQKDINAVTLRIEAYVNTCINGRLPILAEQVKSIIDIELRGVSKEKTTGITIGDLVTKYRDGVKSGKILNNGAVFSKSSVVIIDGAIHSLTITGLYGCDVAKFDSKALSEYHTALINYKLTKGRKYSQNTISLRTNTIFTALKHFYGLLHNNDIFKHKETKIVAESIDNPVIYTIPELLTLYNHSFTGNEEIARDIFVYGCFVGFRQQDYLRHDEKNISKGVISLNTRKRGVDASIPSSPLVNQILAKYGGNPPKMDRVTFIRVIKKVCREAGFTNLVSYKRTEGGKKVEKLIPRCDLTTWHTMRRTCATNLLMGCVELGIPPIESEAVRKMLGWKSDSMIKKYNKSKPEDVAKEKITHPFFNIK